MKVITADLITGKKVIVRLDLDVPLKRSMENGSPKTEVFLVEEDFRLKMGIPTITLIFQNASKVILIGHLGRPNGVSAEYSLKPVYEWFKQNGFPTLTFNDDSNFVLYENLRFDPRESFDSAQDKEALEFAKELTSMADFFVNEAFTSHHPAVSTTLLPTLLPSAAGLRFAEEVRVLRAVRNNPQKPLVAILGGAKLKDKLGVLNLFSQKADAVLIGGKLPQEIKDKNMTVGKNVMVAQMNEDSLDISQSAAESFAQVIKNASQIVWAGPLGRYEEEQSIQGTKLIAESILQSNADILVGGGDTVAALNKLNLLKQFQQKAFVSTGGGAMLKLLSEGTLPTIEALNASPN